MIRTHTQDGVLHVTGLDRLSATNGSYFKEVVKAQLGDHVRFVEIDCAKVQFMDSEGLGALISVHKSVAPRSGKVRLNKVQSNVRQFLELLKFQELFQINA